MRLTPEASWNAIRARSLPVRRVSEYWVCGNEDEENSRKTSRDLRQ